MPSYQVLVERSHGTHAMRILATDDYQEAKTKAIAWLQRNGVPKSGAKVFDEERQSEVFHAEMDERRTVVTLGEKPPGKSPRPKGSGLGVVPPRT